MSEFDEWYEQEMGSENKPEYEAAKLAWQAQQAKIDELQTRIDGGLKIADDLMGEIQNYKLGEDLENILKGNKDEN